MTGWETGTHNYCTASGPPPRSLRGGRRGEGLQRVVEERVKQQQTAPWLPMDANWWPTIAAEMPRPWTRAAVLMDLRWWADQERMGRAKRPGRPTLAKRWGWKDKRTRLILKAENEWGTPSKAENKKGQPRASQGPTRGQDSAPKPTESQDRGANEGPYEGQPRAPRADLHKTQDTTTEALGAKAPMSDKPSQVWDKVNEIRKRHSPEARALKLTKARRSVLKARLEEHTEEELLRVVEWRESSPHHRAQFLRDGGHGIDTLLRASKFEGYLDASFGDQAPTIRKRNGLMDPMTAIRKARESRLRKEAAASGSTVVPFPHPIPKEPF